MLSSASASDSDTDASTDISAIINTRKIITMFLQLNPIAASALCLCLKNLLGFVYFNEI